MLDQFPECFLINWAGHPNSQLHIILGNFNVYFTLQHAQEYLTTTANNN